MSHAFNATDDAARKRLQAERARLLICIATERNHPDSNAVLIQRWITELNSIVDQINQHSG